MVRIMMITILASVMLKVVVEDMHGDYYDFSWGFQHRVVLIKMGVTMIVVKKMETEWWRC